MPPEFLHNPATERLIPHAEGLSGPPASASALRVGGLSGAPLVVNVDGRTAVPGGVCSSRGAGRRGTVDPLSHRFCILAGAGPWAVARGGFQRGSCDSRGVILLEGCQSTSPFLLPSERQPGGPGEDVQARAGMLKH